MAHELGHQIAYYFGGVDQNTGSTFYADWKTDSNALSTTACSTVWSTNGQLTIDPYSNPPEAICDEYAGYADAVAAAMVKFNQSYEGFADAFQYKTGTTADPNHQQLEVHLPALQAYMRNVFSTGTAN